jgi:hypothetical protein
MTLTERLGLETALDGGTVERLEEIGQADIVVGIPSYRNARTVGRVARKASEGLALHFPDMRAVLINADGGSSDDSMKIVAATPVGPRVSKVMTLYRGLLGKGSGVRAIFEVACRVGARACVVLEAKSSATSEWVRKLARPVLDGKYDLVTPLYHRHPRLAAPNDLLAYPMTWALYGVNLRHPIGGDFAVSGDFASSCVSRDVWETDVARFGVDIWLTTMAINEGYKICQVDLGVKTNGLKDPALPMDPRFLQMVGTLFRQVSIYRSLWPCVTGWESSLPECASSGSNELASVPQPVDVLWQAAREGRSRFGRIWRTILDDQDLSDLRSLLRKPKAHDGFSEDLWAKVVYDFAVVYNKGEGDPDKVAQALLPLFYARAASHMVQAERLSAREREPLVQAQAMAFIRQRVYLWDRWVAYVPWMDEGTHISH